jgi:membrane protein DedA with SNARE-associated domain
LDVLHTLQSGVPDLPVAALFFFLFFLTFVSEDAACLLAGTAVAGGRLSFALALAACFLGIVVGDVLLYAAGRAFGTRILNGRLVKRLVPDRAITKASVWLERNGAAAVFLSRFVSGLRLPTYLLAGALRTGFVKYLFFFSLAAALWTPLLIGSAAFSQAFIFPQNAILGLIAIAIVVRFSIRLSSRKDRRLLVGKIKRIAKWEFWPLPVFYAPVVLQVICLAVKHRSRVRRFQGRIEKRDLQRPAPLRNRP